MIKDKNKRCVYAFFVGSFISLRRWNTRVQKTIQ